MRAFSNSDMLQLWERGQTLHPLDQGLLALAVARSESTLDGLADLPLGARNRALAELRSANFGSRMSGWVACSACGEKLEFELDCMELIAGAADAADSVVVDGLSYRLPTSRDLALAARERGADAAALRLVEQCLLSAGAEEISLAQVEEVGERMALADPLAEPQLQFVCALCGHAWEELLDLASFLWVELDARVRRMLVDVHTLASAYGWSEREILSFSEQRRALYLEMVRG